VLGAPPLVARVVERLETGAEAEVDLAAWQRGFAEPESRVGSFAGPTAGELGADGRADGGPERWWHEHTVLAQAREDFGRFIDNIERNFGNDAITYGLIESEENRSRQLARIRGAIMAYAEDRAAWEAVLAAGPRH